ncbi:hypothetical protein ALC60_12434 [Trachymyrmex zeteki]|uniref:DDE Tnp4 domain-containing protein n=1 Tax=Mycetomoellerius zeteki TaxID=64791 RepID=A0A151WKW2_9HYME|nr:hypothetical protein ALC60_12434 [Trachymyrmex zeteki]
MEIQAPCDANYKFTLIDIGQFGSISDGGIWSRTDLAADLEYGRAGLPEPIPLPNRDVSVPYVAVADEAFPLKYLMRPFPRKMTNTERVFNYRLSRARLYIENSSLLFFFRYVNVCIMYNDTQYSNDSFVISVRKFFRIQGRLGQLILSTPFCFPHVLCVTKEF